LRRAIPASYDTRSNELILHLDEYKDADSSLCTMKNIRIAEDMDAEALPDIERSAGQVFREIPELVWIADGEDLTVERHRELIAK